MVKGSDILLILVAILFPPAAAFFVTGCGCDLLINIALTILGYIPGHLHAFWLIYKKMEAETRYGPENWTYLGNGRFAQAGPGEPSGPVHAQPTYGTVG